MPALSHAEIEQHLTALPAWQLAGGDGGGAPGAEAIEREWKLEDFDAAIAFVNSVAALAQEANHHPDILVHGWNKVRLTLSTHSEGGLTASDFELASRIDALA